MFMTFVTSATNAEVSQAQPYYFQSNAPFIHRAFVCHKYVKNCRIYMKQDTIHAFLKYTALYVRDTMLLLADFFNVSISF